MLIIPWLIRFANVACSPAPIKDGFLGCRDFFLFFRGIYSDLLSNGIHYILPPPKTPTSPFSQKQTKEN
jgi:hypothetical protein